MPINTIEVICRPCLKCLPLEQMVHAVIKSIELEHRTTITYIFKHTKSLENVDKYSVYASQAPIVLINGDVEFVNKVPNEALRRRLNAIHTGY